MKKSDIQILVVEDDASSGKVLQEALTRHGYRVKVCQNPKDVDRQFALEDYKLVLMDCMLPQINGVELAEMLRQKYSKKFYLILLSGVFKNSAFSKDALRRTGADHFIYKPFDLHELLEKVDILFENDLEKEKSPLYELLSENRMSRPDLLKAIKATESVQGKDLPMLYSFLMQSQVSGTLELTDPDNITSSIDFDKGDIVEVSMQDKTSYFGVLLIENGFTSSEEVERILTNESEKPIGLRLVDAHAISPHAINVALTQQMSIRMSKTVQENSFQISFQTDEISNKKNVRITPREFHELLSDWIDSKISTEWLVQFYLPWMEYEVVVTENLNRLSELQSLPFLNNFERLFPIDGDERSLSERLAQTQLRQSEALSLLHFLVSEKLVYFRMSGNTRIDFSHKISTIETMLRGIEDKNHFEVLGLNQKARQKEIQRAYMDLVKVLHPDRLEKDAPKKLVKITNKLFSHISESYKVIGNPKSLEAYLQKLNWGSAELAFATEEKIDQGKQLLFKGKYSDAYKLFRDLHKSGQRRPDLPIFLCWSLLKLKSRNVEKQKKILDRATELMKTIPPEERHNAHFFLVKGLFYLRTRQPEKAIVNFRNARTLDPTFAEAKREILAMKQMYTNENTSIFQSMFSKKAK